MKNKLKDIYENHPLLRLCSIMIICFVAGMKTENYLHSHLISQQKVTNSTEKSQKKLKFDRRNIINVTPTEVLKTISKAETHIKQQELIYELYSNKFVLWDIKIEDVIAYDDGTAGIWGSNILAKFDDPDVVLPFKKGMEITVAGNISKAGANAVIFENSKIIEIK